MEGDQNLRRTATLGALASVAIVIGIIVVVWLLFFRNSGSNNGETAKSDNGQSQSSNQSGSGNAGNQGGSQNKSGSTATPTPTPSPSSNSGSTAQGKNMPNTGPTENGLVFLGTGLAATGAYYVYTRRKLARG